MVSVPSVWVVEVEELSVREISIVELTLTMVLLPKDVPVPVPAAWRRSSVPPLSVTVSVAELPSAEALAAINVPVETVVPPVKVLLPESVRLPPPLKLSPSLCAVPSLSTPAKASFPADLTVSTSVPAPPVLLACRVGVPTVALVFNPTTVMLFWLRSTTPVLPDPKVIVAAVAVPNAVAFPACRVPALTVTPPPNVLALLSTRVPPPALVMP